MSANSYRIFSGRAFIFLLLCFLLPPNLPAGEVDAPMILATGGPLDRPDWAQEEVPTSGQPPFILRPVQDPDIAALTARYTGDVGRLLAQIKQGLDPLKAEELQKRCEDTKAAERKAKLELMVQKAEAKGDKPRAAELRSAIENLQKPRTENTAAPAMRPPPAPDAKPALPRVKNPDDR